MERSRDYVISLASLAFVLVGCAAPPPPTAAPPAATATETAPVSSAPPPAVAPVAASKPTAPARAAGAVPPDDPVLARFVGAYPSTLMADRRLTYEARIDALLGKDKRLYRDRSHVETPITVEETLAARYMVFRACMPHVCSIEESLVLVNLATGKVHVAVLQGSTNVRIWSEPGQPPPGGPTWEEFRELAR